MGQVGPGTPIAPLPIRETASCVCRPWPEPRGNRGLAGEEEEHGAHGDHDRDPQERSVVVAEAVAHGTGEGGADEGPEHDHDVRISRNLPEVPPPVEIGANRHHQRTARPPRQAVNQHGEGDDETVRRYDKYTHSDCVAQHAERGDARLVVAVADEPAADLPDDARDGDEGEHRLGGGLAPAESFD